MARSPLFGRRIHISGSVSTDPAAATAADVAAARELVAGFVRTLMRAGANFVVPVDADPQDFLAAYADPRFDVVWVAGHGEIDHWSDGSATLVAGADCILGIDELHAATPREGDRRLAVLNICDGGVSAVNGGIQKLGLAPMLASSRQATVSHLWPVNPLVASAFGVLMASALAGGAGFYTAFDRALAAIRAPIGDIAAAVGDAAAGQDLVARLDNLDLNTSAILHWGSPCFFQ